MVKQTRTVKESIGFVKTSYYTFAGPPDELLLKSGRKLGPITLAYETYGNLNTGMDNGILVLHALSGTAHAAGYHSPSDKYPGWWDNYIGPGKAFDTNKYFVICSNVIGGCNGSTGPSSVNPVTGREYGLDFPLVTIQDMINAQYHLIRHLELKGFLPLQAVRWEGCRRSSGQYPIRKWSSR